MPLTGINCFSKIMQSEFSNHVISLLRQCPDLRILRQTHAKVFIFGLQNHNTISTRCFLLYLKLNQLDVGGILFKNIQSPSSYLCNMMIRTHASAGKFIRSLELYSDMIKNCGLLCPPDKFTFPFALKSCAGLSNIFLGRIIHQHLICFGCSRDVFVNAALVDMYAKCGRVEAGRIVFDRMSERDLVSWTAMISGYAHNGRNVEALEFFHEMCVSGVKVTRVSLLSVLLASGNLGALRKGERFHGSVMKSGFEFDLLVASAMMDMYSKCGSLDLARALFDEMEEKDVVCWSSMIANYAVHGHCKNAIYLFNQMVEAGIRPNHVSFTCVLSACSHAGLVDEGRKYFAIMREDFGIVPKLSNYTCMVDLLGRAGKLSEAECVIENMQVKPDVSIWGSLLGSCQIHGDLDMAERIADRIFELDPCNEGYHVLLSNIYAAKSRWNDVEKIRKIMTRSGGSKTQGYSSIEFNSKIHMFGVGDR